MKTPLLIGLWIAVPFVMLISACQKDEVIPVAPPSAQSPTLNNSKSTIANFTNPVEPRTAIEQFKRNDGGIKYRSALPGDEN